MYSQETPLGKTRSDSMQPIDNLLFKTNYSGEDAMELPLAYTSASLFNKVSPLPHTSD